MPKSREIHLVQRPTGAPRPADFALVEREVADAADGEVLVQNLLHVGRPGHAAAGSRPARRWTRR